MPADDDYRGRGSKYSIDFRELTQKSKDNKEQTSEGRADDATQGDVMCDLHEGDTDNERGDAAYREEGKKAT